MNRLVLIDRDGTINVEQNYLSAPDQIELLPQAADGIKILRELNLPVVVVTNQSGIGRGYFDLAKLEEIHNRLHEVLRENETSIDQIYFCPHTPEDSCLCRKPAAEMAQRAAKDFNAELSKSFVIGDNICDIELGKNIGATTILVLTGYGEITAQEKFTVPDYTVENLFEAANVIKEILDQDGGNDK